MNKWKQLKRQADELSGEDVQRAVWSISEQPQFAGLLAVVNDVRTILLSQGSSVSVADQHGVLAHCLGGVEALDELERRLQSMAMPPPEEK